MVPKGDLSPLSCPYFFYRNPQADWLHFIFCCAYYQEMTSKLSPPLSLGMLEQNFTKFSSSLSLPIYASRWIIEKAGKFQKNIYFCFMNYPKAFDCVDHKNL